MANYTKLDSRRDKINQTENEIDKIIKRLATLQDQLLDGNNLRRSIIQ